MALELIKKEKPITEASDRKTSYILADNMFRFWYRFIPENASLIENRYAERAYQNIEPHISAYMGAIFEEICRQYMWEMNRRGLVAFNDIGRGWGGNPQTKGQEEIDLLAVVDKDTAIFCECKWTNEFVDLDILTSLIDKSRLFNYKNKQFYLFSKSDFTKGCKEKSAEAGNVSLVTFKEMMKEIDLK